MTDDYRLARGHHTTTLEFRGWFLVKEHDDGQD